MGRLVVAVGGTFDALHIGHQYLLGEAVRLGDEVAIGLTSDEFASRGRLYRPLPFRARMEAVLRAVGARGGRARVVALSDRHGEASTSRDIRVLVVTPETYPVAREINRERARRGLRPLLIYVAGYVRNSWGVPVNSTLVRLGLVDAWGRPI